MNEDPIKCQACENKANRPVKIYDPRTAGQPDKRVHLCDECAENPSIYPGAVLLLTISKLDEEKISKPDKPAQEDHYAINVYCGNCAARERTEIKKGVTSDSALKSLTCQNCGIKGQGHRVHPSNDLVGSIK